MSYKAVFGWDSTIEDLLVAYRKVKLTVSSKTPFQQQLNSLNTSKITHQPKSSRSIASRCWFCWKCRITWGFSFTARSYPLKENQIQATINVHFSQPDRAVESLFKNYNVVPEFRIVGDFPVNTHIISALWIKAIGHKFDAKLDDSCYGARLKRIRNDELFTEDNEKPFHISSVGSFAVFSTLPKMA